MAARMLDVKQAVKILTIKRHIKVSDLADALEMTPQSLSNWMYRSDSPKVNTADRVLEHLDCRLAIVDNKTNKILF